MNFSIKSKIFKCVFLALIIGLFTLLILIVPNLSEPKSVTAQLPYEEEIKREDCSWKRGWDGNTCPDNEFMAGLDRTATYKNEGYIYCCTSPQLKRESCDWKKGWDANSCPDNYLMAGLDRTATYKNEGYIYCCTDSQLKREGCSWKRGWDGNTCPNNEFMAGLDRTATYKNEGYILCCKGTKEEPQPKCTDSDGGKDYYVKGTARDIEGEHTDYCENYILYEYYCKGNYATVEKYKCPDICENGACKKEEPTPGFSINLFSGWNLISSPTKEPLTFGEIDKYCEVDSANFWNYSPSKGWFHPSQVANNEGAYIYVDRRCTVEKSGDKAQFSQKALESGWNLFSAGTNVNQIKRDCSIPSNTIIWEYDAVGGRWRQLSIYDTLEQSKGHWIEIGRTCILKK